MKKYMSWLLVLCCVFSLLYGFSQFSENQAKTVDETRYVEQSEEPRESLVEGMNLYPIYKDMRVHFIDVGQGDCTFIELPNGQTMLIDAGESDDGDDIIDYINNIFEHDEIDYVVATHPHEDHIGGMAEVISNFDIGTMYMPEKVHTSYTFENLLDTIEDEDINLKPAKADTNILTSGLVTIDLLAPFDEEYENLNNYSAVVKLTYDETVFLFMGDAEVQVEYKLFDKDIDADVLKVSDTASTEYFISEVTPDVAVISCGDENQYGHPHETALSILDDYGADIYRTDEVGTIVVTTDGHKKITVDKKASTVKENAPPVVVKPKEEPKAETVIQDNQNQTVFRTKSGKKYHRSGCSYLKSKMETTVGEAQSMGLGPCSRCSPPR